jgi:hypothetical protein
MGYTTKGKPKMNVFLDIETIPQQPEDKAKERIAKTIEAPAAMKKPETIADWHSGGGKYEGVKQAAIEDAYRKTSFDGAKGEIISMAFSVEGGEVWQQHRFLNEVSEEALIASVLDSIFDMCHKNGAAFAPFFVGQYVGGFDLKFIFHRCVVLEIKPPFKLPFYGRHGQDFFCTQQAWAGYNGRMSQDNLCTALGIKGKPDDIDGSKVWDFVKAGNADRVGEYNIDDVQKNIEIYNRLTFNY